MQDAACIYRNLYIVR